VEDTILKGHVGVVEPNFILISICAIQLWFRYGVWKISLCFFLCTPVCVAFYVLQVDEFVVKILQVFVSL
jgi:hypothetical protein